MEARAKLREEKVALRELKERVEALLREREYAKVVEEIEAFSKEYTLGERDVEWAELQMRLAFAQEQLGKYDTETAKAAYDVLKLTDRHMEIGTIEWILGRMYLGLGKMKTALRYLRIALSEFDRMEDERRKLQVLNTLGRVCFLSGRPKEAIEHLTARQSRNQTRATNYTDYTVQKTTQRSSLLLPPLKRGVDRALVRLECCDSYHNLRQQELPHSRVTLH